MALAGLGVSRMAINNIQDLRPGTTDAIIEAKGDAMQANMEAADIQHFKSILVPGKAYRISEFQCIPTDNWQQTLENQTSLSFTRLTKLDAIPAETFPHHYFNFLSYNQLPTKIVEPRGKAKKPYPVLTDYIGCYVYSSGTEKIGNPNRNQSIIRRVGIENLNRNYIELTLWDDLAQKFKKEAIDALEKPIIIAVSSCKVSRYRNRDLQLSSTPATYYYINPKIPQLEQYQAQYKELYNQQPQLDIIRYRFDNREQEKYRNRIPLNVLIQQNPDPYQSCNVCSIKARNSNGVYDCREHGILSETSYRYNFKATVTDNTETAQFTFFTPIYVLHTNYRNSCHSKYVSVIVTRP
ncbi:nucleic acid-binding, OB-fold protein [Artemisia annua]|uniref:Nucleic acid-binding, OB-fold protein n=1 Tax=Artemisia annua TaxID=35608 RepID=A0A2U1M8G4_ARTAN|nr:nucleic acid-binding, OB-fold protein [Artemisia annua]